MYTKPDNLMCEHGDQIFEADMQCDMIGYLLSVVVAREFD